MSLMATKTQSSEVTIPMQVLLKPIYEHWEDDTTEIIIIKPQLAIRYGFSRRDMIKIDTLTEDYLEKLLRISAVENGVVVNAENPMLEGDCPNGDRITAVIPPLVDDITFSIRGHSRITVLTHDDYLKGDFYAHVGQAHQRKTCPILTEIKPLISQPETAAKAIMMAIAHKKNIIISGATGTGKSTYLNTLLSLVDKDKRIVTVEVGSRELQVGHINRTYMHCNKRVSQSLHGFRTQDLLELSLRLRPDWLVVGEARSEEIVSFLEAIQSGHPSMITVHAGSVKQAKSRIVMMAKKDPTITYDKEDVMQILSESVDIWLHIDVLDTGKPYLAELEVNCR